jgi:hypothetical protein
MFPQTYVQVLADEADECVVVRLTQTTPRIRKVIC